MSATNTDNTKTGAGKAAFWNGFWEAVANITDNFLPDNTGGLGGGNHYTPPSNSGADNVPSKLDTNKELLMYGGIAIAVAIAFFFIVKLAK